MSEPGPAFLALQDRAYAFVAERGIVSEEALLTHVYGGPPPPALRGKLAAPLHADPRLERRADGGWATIEGRLPSAEGEPGELALTTLVVVATGSHPARGRVVRVCAQHMRAGTLVERFSATVDPGARVPRYVTQRLGLAPELLDDLPPFAAILDDLLRFLGQRPVFAQDARLTWDFIGAEARRLGQVLALPLLIDANALATRVLDLKGKPTLARLAAQLGIGSVSIARPEEEARVLGLLAAPLLALAIRPGDGRTPLATLVAEEPGPKPAATLQRARTAHQQPDEPGVYVLRDVEETALYVGKASRLRSRVAAYVNRPLGATRRLEGLVGAVDAVDATVCATDLEALVLEDRQIRRLQPRFNTVRQQRAPRLWIRLPPVPAPKSGKRQPAARRLEPSLGPGSAEGEFIGPFRNQTLAERARLLSRDVFELDALRHGDLNRYEERLRLAWEFLRLGGQSEAAEACARQRSTRLLREVLAFDPPAVLLPADPREATYAVVRLGPMGIEGFRIQRGVFHGWSVVQGDDVSQFAVDLLAEAAPRTAPEDSAVVLRWLGAQRPPARLLYLPDDPLRAGDAIEAAALDLLDGLVQA